MRTSTRGFMKIQLSNRIKELETQLNEQIQENVELNNKVIYMSIGEITAYRSAYDFFLGGKPVELNESLPDKILFPDCDFSKLTEIEKLQKQKLVLIGRVNGLQKAYQKMRGLAMRAVVIVERIDKKYGAGA